MNNNIIFYLTFKKDLVFFYENLPLREALELMYKHGYTAIPVIGLGRYIRRHRQRRRLPVVHPAESARMQRRSNPIQ